MTIDLERVLAVSRSSEESAKVLDVLSLLADVSLAACVVGAAHSQPASLIVKYCPVLVLVLTCLSLYWRLFRDDAYRVSRLTRNYVMRAMNQPVSVDPITVESWLSCRFAIGDVMLAMHRIAKMSPSEYFGLDSRGGIPSTRMIYLQSAFYSSAILGTFGRTLLWCGAIVLVVGLIINFEWLTSAPSGGGQHMQSDVLYSLVFSVIVARLLYAGRVSVQKSEKLGLVVTRLAALSDEHPEVQGLTYEYEMERMDPILPPTVVYRLMKERLEQRWLVLMRTMGAVGSSTSG
jgi:hypothetical protein